MLDNALQETAASVPQPTTDRSIGTIQRAVAGHFGFTAEQLRSPSREAPLVLARHAAMWITRRATANSYPAIGLRFGNRDHTSVMHAVARVDRLMARDPDFDAEMRALLLPFLPAVTI